MQDEKYKDVPDGLLGQGTFGKVEKVLRISKKDIIARKTISFQNYETRPEAKHAIQREVRVLSRLEHPNIIRYIEVEWEFDHAKLYAEFCDGPNLDVYIERNWSEGQWPSPPLVWLLLFQISAALVYCHSGLLQSSSGRYYHELLDADGTPWEAILHRDIKPRNIFVKIDSDGSPIFKLGDFGFGAVVSAKEDRHTFLGTLGFMAPEILGGSPKWSEKSDVFSLGCTVYYSMTKLLPFRNQTSTSDPLLKIPDRFPEVLRKTLHSCLAFEIACRSQTIAVYKTALKFLAEGDQAQSCLSPSATSTLHKVSVRMTFENTALENGHNTNPTNSMIQESRPHVPPRQPVSEEEPSLTREQEKCLTPLIESLRFPNMNERFRSIDKPVAGTGQWLFSGDIYHHWFDAKNPQECQGLLSLKGKPGAGKSVLIKEAIRRAALKSLGEENSYLILSFFFNSKGEDSLEHSAQGMFRTLLHQILQQSIFHVNTLGNALDLFQRLGLQSPTSPPSCEHYDIKGSLEMLLTKRSDKKIRIFIDALDECDNANRREVAYFWREVTNKAFESKVDLCVCISQRTFPCTVIDKSLDITVDKFNRDDIERYVVKKFSLGFAKAEPRWHVLKDKIMQKSNGVFLWVVLVVEEVLQMWDDEACNLQALTELLEKIPSELQATFSRSLLTLAGEQRLVAKQIFEWAILPIKPRRLHEWHHIMAFIRKPAPKSLKEWRGSKNFTETDDQLERKIRTISCGLIEVAGWTEPPQDPVNDTFSIMAGAGSLDMEYGDTRIVQVIHESVREFFLDGPGFSTLDPEANPEQVIGLGHLSIMHTCLDYLLITELDPLALARSHSGTAGGHIKKRIITIVSVPMSRSPEQNDPSAGSATVQSTADELPPSQPLSSQALAELASFDLGLPQSSMDCILNWRESFVVSNSRPSISSAEHAFMRLESHHALTSEQVDTQLFEVNTTLLSYALFQFFPHAMAAQKGGACPKSIIHRLDNEGLWERWVSLREDIDCYTTLDSYCSQHELDTWFLYLKSSAMGLKKPRRRAERIVRQRSLNSKELAESSHRESNDVESEGESVLSFHSASSDVPIFPRLLSRVVAGPSLYRRINSAPSSYSDTISFVDSERERHDDLEVPISSVRRFSIFLACCCFRQEE